MQASGCRRNVGRLSISIHMNGNVTTMPGQPPVESRDPVAAYAERQTWITPEATTAVQRSIDEVFRSLGPAGEPLRAFLHGTWLHEPLHAVLTDIPVGAWTVTAAFDGLGAISGSQTCDRVADGALGLGLLGATGAAVTGITDWSAIEREAPRRIGAVHAILNVTGVVLMLGSWVARRRGQRSGARWLAFAGYGITSLSAHLGGNLVYEHRIGVRNAA